MKIAASTNQPTLDGELSIRFGRGRFIIIVDPRTHAFEIYPNPSPTCRGNIDDTVAEFLKRRNVHLAVAGCWGLQDAQLLARSGIQVLATSYDKIKYVIEKMQPSPTGTIAQKAPALAS
jgi:predicted Fe-Mo cluster-binding NifX family protein